MMIKLNHNIVFKPGLTKKNMAEPSQESSPPFAPMFHFYVSKEDEDKFPDNPLVKPINSQRFSTAYTALEALAKTDRNLGGVQDTTQDHNFSGRGILMRNGVAQYGWARTSQSKDEPFKMIRTVSNTDLPYRLQVECGLE